jgi:hypothetical protein
MTEAKKKKSKPKEPSRDQIQEMIDRGEITEKEADGKYNY